MRTDLPDDIRRLSTAMEARLRRMEAAVLAASDREELWKARQELEGARKMMKDFSLALESVMKGLD